jgi:hypothetical protein
MQSGNLVDHDHPGSGTGAKHIMGASLVRESHGIELGTDTTSLVHPGPLCLTSEVISRGQRWPAWSRAGQVQL